MSQEYKNPVDTADYKGKYAFVSLGCPKNTVDSERIVFNLVELAKQQFSYALSPWMMTA